MLPIENKSKSIETIIDEKVIVEAERAMLATKESKFALVLRGLRKIYTRGIWCCKKRVVAVNGLSMVIEEGELICLLGHNGAGKTTTISMLNGTLPPSGGDALIYGVSILQDMPHAQSILGVCPQHDILWDELTAEEHLWLFSKLKGVPTECVENEIYDKLKAVDLLDHRDVRSGTFSGGMKRRYIISNNQTIYVL